MGRETLDALVAERAEPDGSGVRFEAPDEDGGFTRAMVVKPFYWYDVERAADMKP